MQINLILFKLMCVCVRMCEHPYSALCYYFTTSTAFFTTIHFHFQLIYAQNEEKMQQQWQQLFFCVCVCVCSADAQQI